MKKYSKTELKAIHSNLNQRIAYCGIYNNDFGEGYITISPDHKWIRWHHYGESAVKNTIKDLKWLLETIFEDCTEVVPAQYSKYHINYIPIDKTYRGIDLSTSHPNVNGL